jgi:Zn-dependent M28 family amino/carboxypeptidase
VLRPGRFVVHLPLAGSLIAVTTALGGLACDGKTTPPEAAAESVEPIAAGSDMPGIEAIRTHVRALSHDAMEGRRPGSTGAERAVDYVEQQMKAIGLAPGGVDSTFRQSVAMRAVQTDLSKTALRLEGKGARPWEFGTDWVGTRFGAGASQSFDVPIVFAGYGVTAPEYEWDDYDVDVKGKVVLVFVGDPPVDDGRFGGPAMTYYGRWSYKYERALEAGAAACLVIHETAPASYGWNVPRTSYSGERFALFTAEGEVPPALGMQGWVSAEAADALAKASGASLETWHKNALDPNFRPIEIDAKLVGEVSTTERSVDDDNLLGVLPGRSRPGDAIFLTAHWDHLGIDDGDGVDGDRIYNGAIDNASGIAAMLAVAETLAKGPGLERSVVFFATTAEEQGLLGSRFYAANPLWPVEKIAGLINLDSVNVHGRTRAVEVVGKGQTTLEDDLAAAATAQNRRVEPDSRPEAGSYYRSDHFPFAKIGVPALYFHASLDLEDGGEAAGEAILAERKRVYHTPMDEFSEDWSFEGTVQDIELVVQILRSVSAAEDVPHFKDGSEFKSIER